jgi:hypothetical protein
MTSEIQRAGVTPYVLRLAAYYAALGCGTYSPKGYAGFNSVVVRELMPWKADAEDPMNSTTILVVEFFLGQRRVKWVEFALKPAGFGGDPIVRAV